MPTQLVNQIQVLLIDKETRRSKSFVFTMTNEGDLSETENIVSMQMLWTGLDEPSGISLIDRDIDTSNTHLAWMKQGNQIGFKPYSLATVLQSTQDASRTSIENINVLNA